MNHTKELIERAHRGDEKARETLVLENMGLIGSIVRRFAGRGYEQEDLFQIGSIGLIKAVDKFDTAFDVKFSTYAVPMITGEIKRFLRDDGMIKVSRTGKTKTVSPCLVHRGWDFWYLRAIWIPWSTTTQYPKSTAKPILFHRAVLWADDRIMRRWCTAT